MLPRTVVKELSDLPIENLDEFNSSVQYFKKTNKLLFNHRLIYRTLRPFLKENGLNTIVDIGTGIADLPVYLVKKLRQKHINCFITGLDTNAQVVLLANEEVKNFLNIKVLCCNLTDLKERFDIAVASQVFHHLSPDEAVDFLKIAYGKVNNVLIISDLIRSRFVYWLVKLFVFFTTTNKINRYDGAVSVLRCYTDSEIKLLLQQAGIKNFKIRNILFRKLIIISKDGLITTKKL